jgi:ABC-type multidrug transport system ATPase subunit
MYLAEKSGRFFGEDERERVRVLEWLFWQIGGLGPMAGQVSHFVNYAPNFPGDHSYSEKRYKNEYDRLLGVMNNVLESREYLAGNYSRGMIQRLGFSMAISHSPTTLFLDEPFTGLDSDGIKIIEDLLIKYKEEGCSIVIVSHDKHSYSERTLKLERGEIV